jgi:flagellin
VEVDVISQAERARLEFPFAALTNTSNVTVEIRGTQGVTTVTFASAATAEQMAEAIAAVADATGISATVSADPTSGFYMESRDFGSREFVKVRVLTEGQSFDTQDALGNPATEDDGKDANATINGAVARADGNHLTMKNPSVELELDIGAGSTFTETFYITGGGALFQVGPDVNTNLQVNMAVNSVTASQLGTNQRGFLSQIKTGGEYALTGTERRYNQAARIVDEAIDQISVLRGRLGSLERNTLDTNMNQLRITSENLTSAESAIRDADFAYETSRLARDQILVNAGTTVLTLANQTTQSVLRLLGG